MWKRIEGLLRDTWWLWGMFYLLAIGLTLFADTLFFFTIPILSVAFFYYAFMRYDDDGNHKGETEH